MDGMTLATDLGFSELAIRLLMSLVIGIIIGLEREIQHKTAGLRTRVLISLGATVFSIASVEFAAVFGKADPSRVAAGIVTGIGFLGAGTIIQTRGSVHGLTTAATIWVLASLGLAVGLGSYILGIGGAVLAIVVLNPFQAIEHAVKGKKTTCTYVLRVDKTGPALAHVMQALQTSPTEAKRLQVNDRGEYHEITFDYTDTDERQAEFARELSGTEGVKQLTTDQGN